MSHISKVKVEFTDLQAVKKAAISLGYPADNKGVVKFYDGNVRSGLTIQLPNWRYPVVFSQTDGGEISMHSDNYGGAWGAESELDKLKAQYSVEVVVAIAKNMGYSYTIEEHEDMKSVYINVNT